MSWGFQNACGEDDSLEDSLPPVNASAILIGWDGIDPRDGIPTASLLVNSPVWISAAGNGPP